MNNKQKVIATFKEYQKFMTVEQLAKYTKLTKKEVMDVLLNLIKNKTVILRMVSPNNNKYYLSTKGIKENLPSPTETQ